MRKNGFTLIELLAVIVILAIIALIATPIILGIINDARIESNERSVELYASAVRNAIATYQLTHTNAAESFSDLIIQYDGEVECATEELYEDGSFYIANCTVNGTAVGYAYGTKQIIKGKLDSVCKPSEEQLYATNELEAGYKYECKVDPNKEPYTFYVLTTVSEAATSINLIMDSNIRENGEAVKEENPTNKGLVAWITKDDYTSEEVGGIEEEWNIGADGGDYGNWNKGPITALNYLQDATKNWSNLKTQTIATFTDGSESYEMPKTYVIYSRLPYDSETSSAGESAPWLIDYLSNYGWQTNEVLGINAYWTLSANKWSTNLAWGVHAGGGGHSATVDSNSELGIRPVITLDI